MKLSKLFDAYSKFVTRLTWVALVVASIMVLLTVYNIAARYLFRAPLTGTLEIIEMAIVVVVFFVVAYTEVRKAHVRVELVVSRLPKRVQITLEGIMKLLAAGFWFLVGWQSWLFMWSRLFPKVSRTDLLSIPIGPFIGIVSLGCILLGIQLLIHCYQSFASLKTGAQER